MARALGGEDLEGVLRAGELGIDHRRARHGAERLDEEARFGDWAALLHEQALLAEGAALEDPAGFVKRMNSLLLELSSRAS